MSELRRDALGAGLLLLSPDHPRGLAQAAPVRGPEGCPLCPGGPASLGPHLAERGGCFATPVARPALRVEARPGFRELGHHEVSEGLGAHELLLPRLPHGAPPQALGARGWLELLQVARARMQDLRGDIRLGPFALSLGWRAEAGARVDHVHAQLHALPEGGLVGIDGPLDVGALEEQRAAPQRRVARVGDFTLLCPFAPRAPFELLIAPSPEVPALERCDDAQLAALATLLQDALRRLHAVLGERPLAWGLLSAPGAAWALRIHPWIRGPSTLEQVLGLVQHEISPERAAEALRAADAG